MVAVPKTAAASWPAVSHTLNLIGPRLCKDEEVNFHAQRTRSSRTRRQMSLTKVVLPTPPSPTSDSLNRHLHGEGAPPARFLLFVVAGGVGSVCAAAWRGPAACRAGGLGGPRAAASFGPFSSVAQRPRALAAVSAFAVSALALACC